MTLLMIIFLIASLLFIALAIPMIKGNVKPNRWYGFRTTATMSSPEIM